MNCPNCQTVMREREKGDIVIDVCPSCRGVWLDAGEMDKLVAVEERVYERRGWNYDDDDDDDDDREDRRRRVGSGYGDDRGRGPAPSNDSRNQQPYPPRKKKGFLSSMLENFGEGGRDD